MSPGAKAAAKRSREFALQQEHAAAQLQGFAQRLQLAELAYLATCNRVELIFARSDRTPVQDLRRDAFNC